MATPQYRVRASLLSLAALVATSSFACAEQVYFSEINYHPKDGKPEFIEILNQSASAIDFANWRLSDGVEYEFPDFDERAIRSDTFMCSFERILVSGVDEATLRAAYPTIPAGVKVFGSWTGALSNGGDNILLEDKNGVYVNSTDYRDSGRKWSVSADGAGHTLTLINPNGSGSDWRNWGASAEPHGTPGSGPVQGSDILLSLSEVHFNVAGEVDWVEVSSSSSDAGPRRRPVAEFFAGFRRRGVLVGQRARQRLRQLGCVFPDRRGRGGDSLFDRLDERDRSRRETPHP